MTTPRIRKSNPFFKFYRELKHDKSSEPCTDQEILIFRTNIRYLELSEKKQEKIAFQIYLGLLALYYQNATGSDRETMFNYNPKTKRISFHIEAHPIFVRIVLHFFQLISSGGNTPSV